MLNVFEEYKGDWVVVDVGAGVYIGRVVDDSDGLTLQPVFDYISRLVQQGNGVGRDVLVLPHDLCATFETPLQIKNYLTLMHFRDMDVSDRNQYESVVQKGADILMAARASKSGIMLTSKMPQKQGSIIMK